MNRLTVISGLDPSRYQRHSLHNEDRIWVEKNCYIDLWVELLHAMRLEPIAMLPFTIAMDFEGDQWTFYKPSHEEIRSLYGVDIQELTIWKPLIEHAIEHAGSGKLIATESDAFWLPDTVATDYRRQHTKTTIVINDIDVDRQRLEYFHNAGYYVLEGEDFVKTFRLDAAPDPAFMPLFAEVARYDRIVRRTDTELAQMSLLLWRKHLERVPATNPIARFRARFESDLADMQQRGLPYYHAWAFASTRQLGSAFELAAVNLQWLQAHGHNGFDAAIKAFLDIASINKTFILKGARAVNSKRPFDSTPVFAELERAWDDGMSALSQALK